MLAENPLPPPLLDAGPLDPALLERASEAPGGFAWWYVDLTRSVGEGAVLLWSNGLPFLPESRQRPLARETGALSLALYEEGRPTFYLLERNGSHLRDVDGAGSVGNSHFFVERSAESLELRAHLDLSVPGSNQRLRGHLRLVGRPPCDLRSGSTGARQLWSPRVLHGEAELDLAWAASRWSLRGSGYFDGNASQVALFEQGIEAWRWGRVTFPTRTFVFYELCGSETERLVWVQEDGAPPRPDRARSFQWSGVRRGLFGMKGPREFDFRTDGGEVRGRMKHLVDDGPFYQRYLAEAFDERGEKGVGTFEFVRVDAIDRPWQRPFVRMRTHAVGGENSRFLPLFSGPRAGRWKRLGSSWFTGASAHGAAHGGER